MIPTTPFQERKKRKEKKTLVLPHNHHKDVACYDNKWRSKTHKNSDARNKKDHIFRPNMPELGSTQCVLCVKMVKGYDTYAMED